MCNFTLNFVLLMLPIVANGVMVSETQKSPSTLLFHSPRLDPSPTSADFPSKCLSNSPRSPPPLRRPPPPGVAISRNGLYFLCSSPHPFSTAKMTARPRPGLAPSRCPFLLLRSKASPSAASRCSRLIRTRRCIVPSSARPARPAAPPSQPVMESHLQASAN